MAAFANEKLKPIARRETPALKHNARTDFIDSERAQSIQEFFGKHFGRKDFWSDKYRRRQI